MLSIASKPGLKHYKNAKRLFMSICADTEVFFVTENEYSTQSPYFRHFDVSIAKGSG